MASVILGKWENTSNENLEEYLKAIGFGAVNRDAFPKDAKSFTEFTESEGKITQKNTVGPVTITEFTFELGVEFEREFSGPGGVKGTSKAVVKLEGNKLLHKGTVNGVEVDVVHEFDGDEMVAVFTVGPVVCTRKYKKVA